MAARRRWVQVLHPAGIPWVPVYTGTGLGFRITLLGPYSLFGEHVHSRSRHLNVRGLYNYTVKKTDPVCRTMMMMRARRVYADDDGMITMLHCTVTFP